jgi:hypothetical protein
MLMSETSWVLWIFIIIFSALLILIISLGLFDGWTFTGLIFFSLLYLGGYLYVSSYFRSMMERDLDENEKKRKFDYCWNRVNHILRSMAGGEGLEWDGGQGRRSEFRSYYDGVQHRAFRSMMGYIASKQQLAIVIYDIDKDDIVRFYADPSPYIISDHFADFKPFQTRSGLSGDPYSYRRRYPYRSRLGRGVSIHLGDGDGAGAKDFDSFGSKYQPDDNVVDDALSKLREKSG